MVPALFRSKCNAKDGITQIDSVMYLTFTYPNFKGHTVECNIAEWLHMNRFHSGMNSAFVLVKANLCTLFFSAEIVDK